MLGYCGCHSSFLPLFNKVAAEYKEKGHDIKRLIVEVSAVDRKRPSEELIRETEKRWSDISLAFLLSIEICCSVSI